MSTKKIFAFLFVALLTCAAVLGGLGGAAHAANPPAISDTYVIDGITYYNVNSSNFDSPKKFYEDVFSAKHSSLGGRSLGDMWMLAAVGAGKTLPLVSSPAGMSSALDYAKEAVMKGQYGSAWGRTNYLHTYTAPQWDNSGYVETALYVQAIGVPLRIKVRFSDFGVGVLLPGNTKHYVSTTVENDTPKGEQPATTAKNDTANTATLGQSITKTITASLASTINHSFSYGFTEGVKIGFATEANAGFAAFKISGEVSFSASQTISDGWSKTDTKTDSKTVNNSISVSLPPYTTAMMKQGETNSTVTTNYNCPVILSYKVTIIYEPSIGITSTITFDRSASNNLKQRALIDVDYDPQRINWRTVTSDRDFKNAIEKIATHVPMSATGAKMVYTDRTTYNEVSGIVPLYPLRSVALGWPNLSFINGNKDNAVANMTVGEYSYTNYLPLEGKNEYGAAYYGFNASYGAWRVVDEAGNELTGDSAPVVLEKTSSGYMRYTAKNPGKCFLKYFINEDAYPDGIGSKSHTKNGDLARTAQLEINVHGEKVNYEIDGEYSGLVNGEPENIEAKGALGGQLEVHAYDDDDIEVDAPYLWQKRELKGITMDANGTVSFTQAGTYHVRVRNKADKNIYSEWKAITAEVTGDDYVPPDEQIVRSGFADGDTQFVITGRFVGGVNVSESIVGEGKFQVETHTSDGQETAVQYTWEAQEEGKGITLDAESGQASFDNPGVYHVRVKEGEFHSDWITIDVKEIAPARITHAPTPHSRDYDGITQFLVYDDARYDEGGVRMFYGLGKDAATEPEEYSTERPEATAAGTYYVWYKVQGDENHTDSDPACVEVKIAGDGNSDGDGDSGRKSSSGGCDMGLGGFAALGLTALVVALRRKVR